jgi:mRNA-decapping enzyme subunit 2
MDDSFVIPENVLNDLCSRFIINVPVEERSDLIRIFFQIEIAHWFYLDFFCTENSDLKPVGIRSFAENIFHHCSFLIQHSNQVDDILSKWKIFKHAVPTNGAIIIDESIRNVLLVQGFWAKASWGFPKGKVLEEETEMKCAIREVLEETGYDITDKIREDQFLQISINDQVIRLYIIVGVSKNTQFEPRTRREIKDVRWFSIDDLPTHRKDTRTKQTLGYSPNAFFMVIPFVKPLKQWMQSSSYSVSTTQQIQILKRDSSNHQNLNAKVKQTQYYNKISHQQFDEILRLKESPNNRPQITTSKSNSQINLYANSRFKPVNSRNQSNVFNSSGRKSNSYQTFKQQTQQDQTQPIQFQHQQQQQHQENIKLKAKKLQFDGPECWINFKFDLEEIIKDLPEPILASS